MTRRLDNLRAYVKRLPEMQAAKIRSRGDYQDILEFLPEHLRPAALHLLPKFKGKYKRERPTDVYEAFAQRALQIRAHNPGKKKWFTNSPEQQAAKEALAQGIKLDLKLLKARCKTRRSKRKPSRRKTRARRKSAA